MSLDQKLKQVDYKFRDAIDAERAMPHKAMEERIMKLKRDLEQKYQNDLESEIARLKQFEAARIRFELEAKQKEKMDAFRNEFETMHMDKLKELKMRESEILNRIKSKE